MKEIWKFPLEIKDGQTIQMPQGARVLCVQTQYDWPRLWAEVETTAKLERRHFDVFGTGHPMPEAERRYVGTFQVQGGSLIFHVYERLTDNAGAAPSTRR